MIFLKTVWLKGYAILYLFSGVYLGFDTVHDVDKLPGSATWTVKDVQLY